MYRSQIYSHLVPSGFVATSDMLSLDLYSCGGVRQPVTGLEAGIEIVFPVRESDPLVYERVQQVLREGRNLSEYVFCSYYDVQRNTLSFEGCALTGVTRVAIKCKCSHMTDYLALVKTQDIETPDYSLFKALSDLSRANLGENRGFIFAIVYTLLYLVVSLILQFIDKRRKNPLFFTRLFFHISRTKFTEQRE